MHCLAHGSCDYCLARDSRILTNRFNYVGVLSILDNTVGYIDIEVHLDLSYRLMFCNVITLEFELFLNFTSPISLYLQQIDRDVSLALTLKL